MNTILSGTLIGGKYQVTELLGVGGMAQVYHARHISVPEFEVAIKMLDPQVTSLVATRDRFRNEVVAGYRANHFNVVQMYEYFDLGELQAFAMEFVAGGTLLELMQEGPVPIDIAVSLIKQVASGLAALHRAGTIHRDLKPDNVLLTPDGIAKITDFGVAHIRGALAALDDGQLIGTPRYVAPEYVETKSSDHRADIYALGVIGYELLSGISPFRSKTQGSLLKERLEQRGHDLQIVNENVPPALAHIIQRAMAISLTERYTHAEDLAIDLAKVQSAFGYEESFPAHLCPSSTRVVWQELIRSTAVNSTLDLDNLKTALAVLADKEICLESQGKDVSSEGV